MTTKTKWIRRIGVSVTVMISAAAATAAWSPPTAFTYQGRLEQSGAPVTGSLPMVFRLYDAATGGAAVGPAITIPGVSVAEGLFTQALDFGAVDSGTRALWLEIAVDGFVLSPRQAITASPYSLQTRGIHVDEAGRVGIGTDDPEVDLDVAADGATIRTRSTDSGDPARVVIEGDIPGPLGGVHGSIDFADGDGTTRFGIQYDTAFSVEYFTVRTPEFPTGLLRIRDDGFVGLGDLPSIAPLHVTDRDIGVFNDGMVNETLAIEDNDAVFGIYSSNTGNFGSAIALGESVGNRLVDKWGLVRTTSNTSPQLRVTYGPDPNYAQNPTAVTFVPDGLRFPDGSLQRWAAVVDSGAISSSPQSIDYPVTPILVDPVTVEITSLGQSVLVIGHTHGFHGAMGFSIPVYALGYRPAGSGAPPILISEERSDSEDNEGSVNQFERFEGGCTAVVDGLPPGLYQFGFRIRDIGTTRVPPRHNGADVSVIVF